MTLVIVHDDARTPLLRSGGEGEGRVGEGKSPHPMTTAIRH